MQASLTVVRYPPGKGYYGFLSMALFRFYLYKNKSLSFYKLLGCGKNGSFDVHPDWLQWGIITATEDDNLADISPKKLYGNFIANWWKRHNCEVFTILLKPIEGHGVWDGKQCFGNLPKQTDYEGQIAVLTRATIRLSKLKAFWANVQKAAAPLATTPGFITSIGIGEVPWIKQATFSVWDSKTNMKNYAYRKQDHSDVIQKTRREAWYAEEMFVRFIVLKTSGTLHGKNPLNQ